MKKAAMAGALGFGLLIALLLSMFLIIASDEDSGGSGSGLYISVNLSAEVLAHQPMVEKYARQNGISDYVYVLLAIIQVESEGKLSGRGIGLRPVYLPCFLAIAMPSR